MQTYETIGGGSVPGDDQLVPPVLRPLKVHPTQMELRADYDPSTKETRFTYLLTWNSADDAQKQEAKLMQTTTTTTSSTSSSASNSRNTSSEGTTTKFETNDVNGDCDGPCHGQFPVKELSSLGRCNHNLCPACYGLVVNEDGSPGCSSFECTWKYQMSKSEVCRKQRKKARKLINSGYHAKVASPFGSMTSLTDVNNLSGSNKSGSSSSSNSTPTSATTKTTLSTVDALPSLIDISRSTVDLQPEPPTYVFPLMTEMVPLRIIILESGPFDTTTRVHLNTESPAWRTLSATLETIVSSRGPNRWDQKLLPRVYFITLTGGRRQLKAVLPDEMKLQLFSFPLRYGMLTFVLDTIGYIQNRHLSSASSPSSSITQSSPST